MHDYLLTQGCDLLMCGYDVFPVKDGQTLEQAYLDSTKPFGHELVLFTMLTSPEADWPWLDESNKTVEF